MDQQIKLRNAKTEQECDFDSNEAAQNFVDHVEDSPDWWVVTKGAAEGATIASPEEVHTLTEIVPAAELLEPAAATISPVDAPDTGAGEAATDTPAA